MLLEDGQALVNVVVFPALYEERRRVVRGEPFSVVEGILKRRNDTTNVVAERLWPLEAARVELESPDDGAPPADRATDATVAGEPVPPAAPGTVGAPLRAIAPPSHDYR